MNAARYVARRAAHAIGLLVLVSFGTFLLLDLAPGRFLDEARLDPRIDLETLARMQSRLGAGQPLLRRYARWAAGAVQGDFGESFAYGRPVAALLAPRIRNTLLLTSTALVLSWLLALACGTFMALAPGGWFDRGAAVFLSAILAIPDFVLACLFLAAAARTGLLPAGGMHSPGEDATAANVLRHMILPVAVLVLAALPPLARHTRQAVAQAAAAPFCAAGLALGIPRFRWLRRYVLRAAANPLLSLFGLTVGGLLSGSLVVEATLGWPGLGPAFLQAVAIRDVPVILYVVILSAALLAAGNLAADLLLYASDPRISRG